MTPPTEGKHTDVEYLVSCAIERNSVVESRGFKEHWQIRAALGDVPSSVKKPGDNEGFLTNTGRFVNRREARVVGSKAGQCSARGGDLISSNIDRWTPHP